MQAAPVYDEGTDKRAGKSDELPVENLSMKRVNPER